MTMMMKLTGITLLFANGSVVLIVAAGRFNSWRVRKLKLVLMK